MLWSLTNALNYRAQGIPAVLLRGISGISSGKSHRIGGMAQLRYLWRFPVNLSQENTLTIF